MEETNEEKTGNKALDKARAALEELTAELETRMNTRLSIVKHIVALKAQHGLPLYDPIREQELLNRVSDPGVRAIMKQIIQLGRKRAEADQRGQKLGHTGEWFGDRPWIIFGPCAIESKRQLEDAAQIAWSIRGCIYHHETFQMVFRMHVFKPRTHPSDFQGPELTTEFVTAYKRWAKELKSVGFRVVAEAMSAHNNEDLLDFGINTVQIGTRNCQNYRLLQYLAKEQTEDSKDIVILKRGASCTLEEYSGAIAYLLRGHQRVVLCERGIKSFDSSTRNTLDLSAVPLLKQRFGLPVIVDLSHSLGRKDIVESMARAALSCGADGLLVEVHPYPEQALSDPEQQLTEAEFRQLMSKLMHFWELINRDTGGV